ncbi:MAG: hypothetical protein HC886_05350 [Leptolyngbyaceae cyanobacterium SM1_1_3]|nr:hypothetical protein [Leptolyngbyaceae cyanobacterium SM1_1_3]NJN03693.1 hypothetical protein [Leptolyngbyaceae cyanobacterium RM1_1_2]NJO09325.1 hypothetical protein [Leptolyngbyaceae cyanobacterium SL_1_1]
MASQQQVREYLAYWFQLGKSVVVDTDKSAYLPEPVFQGDRYSDAFESCWQKITAQAGREAYVEGTDQTIRELLSDAWALSSCARCTMPVPVRIVGVSDHPCPCNDLPSWPNSEIPAPRSAVSTPARLQDIRQRLAQPHPKADYTNSPDYSKAERS